MARQGAFRVIANTSRYTTASVKAFLRAAMKAEGVDSTGYQYTIRPCRRSYDKSMPYGWAYFNSRVVMLSVPAPEYLDMERLARVTVHELAHNRGVRKHREMLTVWDDSLDVSWVQGVTLEPKVTKCPPKRDLVNERHIHAAKMLAAHEKSLRRKQKLVKKWRDKVRYYERTTAKRAAVARQRARVGAHSTEGTETGHGARS